MEHVKSALARPAVAALFALLILCAAPAHAFRFLPADRIDFATLLAPPPAASSPEQARDLAEVLKAQSQRTSAQIERATADNDLSVVRFADVLGPSFRPERLPAVASFFEELKEDCQRMTAAAKRTWERPRPFVFSSHVKLVGSAPRQPASYPSGHATVGYLNAIVLAEMVPEKRDELFARGREYGTNRVIAGAHFPSHVEAGRIAATLIVAALKLEPAYRAEFARARAELRGALGLD